MHAAPVQQGACGAPCLPNVLTGRRLESVPQEAATLHPLRGAAAGSLLIGVRIYTEGVSHPPAGYSAACGGQCCTTGVLR